MSKTINLSIDFNEKTGIKAQLNKGPVHVDLSAVRLSNIISVLAEAGKDGETLSKLMNSIEDAAYDFEADEEYDAIGEIYTDHTDR